MTRLARNDRALAAIAEQRHEIGDEAVDRLDDPGEVERRERGGDLHRSPGMDLLEVVDERLRDDAVGDRPMPSTTKTIPK